MTGRGALGLAALVDCAGQPCALHSPERYTSTMNHHHVRNALVEVYSQTTWRSSARRTPCIGLHRRRPRLYWCGARRGRPARWLAIEADGTEHGLLRLPHHEHKYASRLAARAPARNVTYRRFQII